jgi:hypothetical protein
MQYFEHNKLLFPKRLYGGEWKGKLVWKPLLYHRALQLLHNPAYAGTYVFGRRYSHKQLSTEGNVNIKTVCRPLSACPVVIHDHHEGYISFETYEENQRKMCQNYTSTEQTILPSAAREGHCLLQGLMICGQCGYRLNTRYKNHSKITPVYYCNRYNKRMGENSTSCFSVSGRALDEAISQKILEIMTPYHLEIALKAYPFDQPPPLL